MKDLSKVIEACEKFLGFSSCSFLDKMTILSENSQPSLDIAFYSVPTIVHTLFKIADKIICLLVNIKYDFFLYSISFLYQQNRGLLFEFPEHLGSAGTYCLVICENGREI